MKREDVPKYQKAQVKLLQMIDEICKEQGIGYFLAYGSLIGAVRHHGFIPWDVDMDIMMYRADYDRFCAYMKEHEGMLYLDHYSNNKYHVSPHAIVRVKGTHVYWKEHRIAKDPSGKDGIYIDVFPLDNLSDDAEANKRLARRIYFRQRLMDLKVGYYHNGTSRLKMAVKRVLSSILICISYEQINRSIDKLSQTFNKTHTENIADYTLSSKLYKVSHKRSTFGTPVPVKFDDIVFTIPADADTVLRKMYGDYMKLPPENKRWEFCDNMIDAVDYGTFYQ